jgi:hypothetical protein
MYNYDKYGYDKDGYDKDGFDRDGIGRNGYSRDGFDRDGFDRDGYDKDGYDEEGFYRTARRTDYPKLDKDLPLASALHVADWLINRSLWHVVRNWFKARRPRAQINHVLHQRRNDA